MNRARRSPKPTSPLASTALEVTITDLVAEYVVRHRFQNDGKESIEAVFSFPVPLDAAFLGMRATLAGETLVAGIQPQRQASRTYDDAIAGGHSAVLLSAPEPGLLCTSLGNLMPGETGEIELRFATALRVADRSARFSLPLVHRPRYGTWRLEDLETPTHDFAVEHPMSALIRVEGLLASAPVTCSTHAARFARSGAMQELSIGQAMLDRDLVLTFELADDLEPVARLIEDGESSLGLVSFVLPSRQEAAKPLDLCLLLDGSGSMSGDAIAQSRQALAAIIGALGDEDRIQVLRYGSSVVPMFRRPLLATPRVREALGELISTIDSELGGTEMGVALERALGQLGDSVAARSRAIIIVTDGAVQPADILSAQAAAIAAGVRIFVVAVGSSAGAEVLGPLAEATGAVLERAVPGEPIDAGVMRQFRRAREVEAVALQVTWPGGAGLPIPMGIAYPGDAVNVAATLPADVLGEVFIAAPSLGFSLRVPLGARSAAAAMRALLGQQRYRLAARAEREFMALRYGLLTQETSAVLVKLRADGEKAEGMPTIVPVPQMVTEGMVASFDAIAFSRRPAAYMAQPSSHIARHAIGVDDYLDVPAFLRRQADTVDVPPLAPTPAPKVIEVVEISREQALRIFEELSRILRDALLHDRDQFPKLGQAVSRLPKALRQHARALLSQCDLQRGSVADGARLLNVLTSMLNEPALTDEEEAMLAVVLARSGQVQRTVEDDFGFDDVEICITVETALQGEFRYERAESPDRAMELR